MSSLERAWRARTPLACALWPVSLLMLFGVNVRKALYRLRILRTKSASVPVIVVGNLSVGGTGKSPLTAALVEPFVEMDWRPGIVARGYGGRQITSPQSVSPSSDPSEVGDEPVMLAEVTGLPVCVCADRAEAVKRIVQQHDVNLVFSDDGLQHYAMARDAEIVVVDESRGFGNRWLLPAGPLREPLSRLKTVSLLAVHKSADRSAASDTTLRDLNLPEGLVMGSFRLQQTHLRELTDEGSSVAASTDNTSADRASADKASAAYDSTNHDSTDHAECQRAEHKSAYAQCANTNSAMADKRDKRCISTLSGKTVHAMAGIGHPARFFRQLELAGIKVIEHPRPDHHVWSLSDLSFEDEYPIAVTSKDAVKIKRLMREYAGTATIYEVCVTAVLGADLCKAVADIEHQLHESYRQTEQGVR